MRPLLYLLIGGCLMSGCTTSQMATTDPNAVLTGAAVGGQLGGAIGGLIGDSQRDWHSGYRGSAIGTIVGTLAGAAIGGAISSSRQKEQAATPTTVNNSYQAALDGLRIHRIRFIDDSRDRLLSPNESSKVVFEIVNEGSDVAFNVVPMVSERSGCKRITISPSILVEQIRPGEGVKYTATVTAGKRIKQSSITLRLSITDAYGNEHDWHEFQVQTEP